MLECFFPSASPNLIFRRAGRDSGLPQSKPARAADWQARYALPGSPVFKAGEWFPFAHAFFLGHSCPTLFEKKIKSIVRRRLESLWGRVPRLLPSNHLSVDISYRPFRSCNERLQSVSRKRVDFSAVFRFLFSLSAAQAMSIWPAARPNSFSSFR